MQELEDLYLPYRPKKRTRAQIAREKGLEPLAELITQQVQPPLPLEKLAALHIDAEKGVNSAEEAWQGAMDIVAENISDNAAVRDFISQRLFNVRGLCRTCTPPAAAPHFGTKPRRKQRALKSKP